MDVEALLVQEQIDPLGMQVRQEAQEVSEGPTKPINRPRRPPSTASALAQA